jgi:hypothetical protein
MGSDGGGVYLPQVKIDPPLLIELEQQPFQYAIKKATHPVTSESIIHRFTTPVALGQVPPRGATAQYPKHPVHHFSMLPPLTTPFALATGKQIGYFRPLLIG